MRKVTSAEDSLNPDCASAPEQPALEKRWMTIGQIATRYQLSERTIANMMADGRLPYYKVGRAIRFDPVECDRAMRAFRRASKFDQLIDNQGCADCESEIEIERCESFQTQDLKNPQKPSGLAKPFARIAGEFAGEPGGKKRRKSSKNGAFGKRGASSRTELPLELCMPLFRLKIHKTRIHEQQQDHRNQQN